MFTMKKLNEKISDLEKQLIRPTDVTYVARKTLYKNDETYEKEKENIIKRGFKFVKAEKPRSFLLHFGYQETEVWEKEYATGEF